MTQREAGDELSFLRRYRTICVEETLSSDGNQEKDATVLERIGQASFASMTPDAFGRFVLLDRRAYAVKRKWRRSKISMQDVNNLVPNLDRLKFHPGVYRRAIDVFVEAVENMGGFANIPEYVEQAIGGSAERYDYKERDCSDVDAGVDESLRKRRSHKIRSSWRESGAFEAMTAHLPRDASGTPLGKALPIGVYEDGVVMAKSGSQSVQVLMIIGWVLNLGKDSNSYPSDRSCVVVWNDPHDAFPKLRTQPHGSQMIS